MQICIFHEKFARCFSVGRALRHARAAIIIAQVMKTIFQQLLIIKFIMEHNRF